MGVPRTVAIMQPYFAPYAGYFRLIATADLFVVYDCVQFPRRGWVHRNRFPRADGSLDWLTLPLAKAPRDVLIRDLAFRADAAPAFARQIGRFPALAGTAPDSPLAGALRDLTVTPLAYLVRLLGMCCALLRIPFAPVSSSSMGVPPGLHGTERLLEIARRAGASRYLNAPGGRELYRSADFSAAGVELRFLRPYDGPAQSILPRLLIESPAAVREEILARCDLEA